MYAIHQCNRPMGGTRLWLLEGMTESGELIRSDPSVPAQTIPRSAPLRELLRGPDWGADHVTDPGLSAPVPRDAHISFLVTSPPVPSAFARQCGGVYTKAGFPGCYWSRLTTRGFD
ncbi:hypothetical protein ACU8KH_04945 [Lachancea thermotolerans]